MKALSINKILILLAGLFIATSCSKDDVVELPAKQNPITSFITDSNLMKDADAVDGYSYEFGVYFTPQKNGTIENFIITIPADGNYRVTLWNITTESIITEEIVSALDNVEKKQIITPIEVSAGKQYAISINTESWKTWTDSSDPYNTELFPKTVGDIKLDQYAYSNGTDQKLPKNVYNKSIAGFLDFTFQPAAE